LPGLPRAARSRPCLSCAASLQAAASVRPQSGVMRGACLRAGKPRFRATGPDRHAVHKHPSRRNGVDALCSRRANSNRFRAASSSHGEFSCPQSEPASI
jgi:hypothetical protein